MNETNFDKAVKSCIVFIGESNNVTDDVINDAVDRVTMIYNVNREDLIRKLHSLYNIVVDAPQILVGRERREPWLYNFKSENNITWPFWERYKTYLALQKNFVPSVIDKLDALTDDILDKLFNPNLGNIEISKKGLVVGHVQSGKTANYIGLICKAADAGFNFIIVLAGIHNNLRSQTQTRLDEGFLGFDTQYERAYNKYSQTKIGVGRINDKLIANSYTTSHNNGDFTNRSANTAGFNFNMEYPMLLVVKKNITVLNRLHAWLRAQSQGQKINSKSLLLIDDEADNASINTNRAGFDPTAINHKLKDIFNMFSKSAYVGYTATPYANIFIPQNEEDFFPRDFIINLPAPSNYIGPDKVFGTALTSAPEEDVLPIVYCIKDFNDFVPTRHRKDSEKPTVLPDSLKLAIKCFILTCAIRIARGQNNCHNSMLIHVSRFQSWQNHIKELVENEFRFYKDCIQYSDHAMIEEFRKVFEVDAENYISFRTTSSTLLKSNYRDINAGVKEQDWEEIRSLLNSAVQKIQVKSINGASKDALQYYECQNNGLSVIVIGGDKMSRGLTLEGLSVSYFLRASKMYDTLMQMGRWFGYRPGYVDLCRLFISPELNEWYRHITLANEELREEFSYLYESGGTPEDYALKVRNHPGVLQITSVAKMRNVDTIQVSWAGKLIESYQLEKNVNVKRANLNATITLLGKLGCYATQKGNYLWREINPDLIIDFMNDYKLPKGLVKVNLDLISEYVKEMNNHDELTHWNVALMSRVSNTEGNFTFVKGITANNFMRSCSTETTQETYYIRKNHILGGPQDEFIDLDDDVIEQALKRTRDLAEEKGEEWKFDYPKPIIVRKEFRNPQQPLLILYPLSPRHAKLPNDLEYSDEPFIGFAISFPSTKTNVAVSYTVNQIRDFSETENVFDEENDNNYDNQYEQ